MTDEDYDLVSYKDVSELRKELEGIKDRRDVPTKDLHEAVHKLTTVMSDMLELFAAAAEQMKLEEKEYETEAKKHEMIVSKLDKLIDQNKTIAEGMVAIVDMVKEKFPDREGTRSQPKEDEQPLFTSAPEPRPFRRSQQSEWKPKEQMMPRTPQMQPMPQMPQMMPPPSPQPFDFGMQMPPMEPVPMPDLNFPEDPFSLEQEPKKKGMFAMFKK